MGAWKHRIIGDACACGNTDLTIKQGRLRCRVAIRESRGKTTPERNLRNRRCQAGIPKTERDALLEGAVCSICGSDEYVFLDHCHATMKIRGPLCRNCNWGLGHFRDDVQLLQGAIAYLTAPE